MTHIKFQMPSWQLTLPLLIFIIAGCFLTRILNQLSDWNLVICAITNTLIWSVLPSSWLNQCRISRFLLLDGIYIGSFLALDIALQSPIILVAACLLGCLVYLISNPYLAGLGGRLGTQAFVTCCLLIGIDACLSMTF